MIKLIVIIDSVRGIPEQVPNEIFELMQSKIAKGPRITLYRPFPDLEPIDQANKLNVPVWLLGNATEQEYALEYAEEVHIIQINGILKAQEYFPSFESSFYMHKRKPIQQVNGLQYQYQIWKAKRLASYSDSESIDARDS